MREYDCGNYLTGFRESEKKNYVICGETKNELIFITDEELAELGRIKIKEISNVTLEDKTSIDKRITLTRVALLGIFAFGLQKKRKDEVFFLVIDHKPGKIEETVVFEFLRRDTANSALFNIKERVNES